jgi:hypothetical protein
LRVQFEPSTPNDVENVEITDQTNSKKINNGYLYIMKDDVEYNVQGAVVK